MDQTIKIRVSAEDKASFEASASLMGLSLSAYVRMILKRQWGYAKDPNTDKVLNAAKPKKHKVTK